MCRHRVMLVLSLSTTLCHRPAHGKKKRWDPAIWLEELATLPDATRKRAQALVAKGITIELFCAPGEIPSARLPMTMCVFIPVAVFVSPVVIVLKAHFANMSYWLCRPSSRPKRSKQNLTI
ncbi:zinc finger SWIM domain-containing protein [Escherichia coli]|uniref:Zinc finger SWIM domain-containing protein n=1 Tax=Escherichia coli TaxID=562 RepID=A0A376U740_ECOLX|nr:zinc finger SWIM domain-containing protein [Escherichia coli]